MNLLALATSFGLAAGAGTRAGIPVLALGLFHHSPWYELSPAWQWIAEPPVMIVLAALLLVEMWADANPDIGELSDLAAYLPKICAGFLAFAASTGSVDPSLAELMGSGVLGGATAGFVHYARNLFRRPIRQLGEGLHEGVGKLVTLGETGTAITVSAAAVLAPPAALGVIAAAGFGGWLIWRTVASKRESCPACPALHRRGAMACPGCGVSLAS